jgi:uncharacterized membrane protein YdjX (TVP38/TMEM64 family)
MCKPRVMALGFFVPVMFLCFYVARAIVHLLNESLIVFVGAACWGIKHGRTGQYIRIPRYRDS